MKYVRFLIVAITVILFASTSCIERKHCWRCTYVYSLDSNKWGNAIVCDKTKEQIREYEKTYGSKVRPVYVVRCNIK